MNRVVTIVLVAVVMSAMLTAQQPAPAFEAIKPTAEVYDAQVKWTPTESTGDEPPDRVPLFIAIEEQLGLNLAETLSRYVDRPVVDHTNLKDVLDFDLTWTTLENAGADTSPGCHPSVLEMAKRPRYERTKLSCPSIFTAVREQLGLRLEARRVPIPVLVIDSVQPPTPD